MRKNEWRRKEYFMTYGWCKEGKVSGNREKGKGENDSRENNSCQSGKKRKIREKKKKKRRRRKEGDNQPDFTSVCTRHPNSFSVTTHKRLHFLSAFHNPSLFSLHSHTHPFLIIFTNMRGKQWLTSARSRFKCFWPGQSFTLHRASLSPVSFHDHLF